MNVFKDFEDFIILLQKDVYFISFKDLLKNKRASNRKKDNFDIQWLKDYGKDSKEI